MIAFFIDRPLLASVASCVILLLGGMAIFALPISQYPNVVPPTVTLTATYTGASAQAVEASVTTPLEQTLNGIVGLHYTSSQSSNDGTSIITCTFDVDRNLEEAANDIQNAVNSTAAVLPSEVTHAGIHVTKNAAATVITVGFLANEAGTNLGALSDFVDRNVVNELRRIAGVSAVTVFDERKNAMRIWIDPRRLAANGLTVDDVLNAIRAQNVAVAAGAVGAAPTTGHQLYEYGLRGTGLLHDVNDFSKIILKVGADGGFVRLRDVSRIEKGAADYSDVLRFDGRPAVGVGVQQSLDGNALWISRDVRAVLDRLQARFPGIRYQLAYDRSAFVSESIREVFITLAIAIALVVLVLFVFLQDWRAMLIPVVTIPISLVGTLAAMKALGFSINTLTLFGLTLATGLVVDDAIVVVENIARTMRATRLDARRCALDAMREIQGAVVASSLVLLAVFIPVVFCPGTTGILYRQFAITIACSISISLLVALTLAPTFFVLLVPPDRSALPRISWASRAVTAAQRFYDGALRRIVQHAFGVAAAFCVLLAATGVWLAKVPTGFLPAEDQGLIVVVLECPSAFSIDQTGVVQRAVEKVLHAQPEVAAVFDDGGQSLQGSAANFATMFVRLKPWSERRGSEHAVQSVIARINAGLELVPDAQAIALMPSAIPGLGSPGGFSFDLEDRGGGSLEDFKRAADQLIAAANAPGTGLSGVYTSFQMDKPTLLFDVDMLKALHLHVPVSAIANSLQAELGSLYVNNFDIGGQSYRVYVQADAPFRSDLHTLDNLYVAASDAASANSMIPISSLLKIRQVNDPATISHFNSYRAIEIGGSTTRGFGTGQSITTVDSLSDALPSRFGHEWSGIAREEVDNGPFRLTLFGLGAVFVLLVLLVQYRSLTDPLVIMFGVPLALLGALCALALRHGVLDVFAQVGCLMLVGLATKNAILIVEFANQLQRRGVPPSEAVFRSALIRLRPIAMTSIAFMLGVLPFVFAHGAGSTARQSLGTVVLGGMLVSTLLNLVVVPALYIGVNRFVSAVGLRSRRLSEAVGAIETELAFSSLAVMPPSGPPAVDAESRW